MLLASALPVPDKSPDPCSTSASTFAAQDVVGRGEHRVGALVGELDRGHVAGVIDEVSIVAGRRPDHGVGAGGAVEQVVPGVAVERVRWMFP